MSAETGEALAAVAASAAALAAFAGAGEAEADPDPLRARADACLDGLAEVARLEARTAALKARLTAEYVHAAEALAPPPASPQQCTAWEMATVAEVACALTVSERTAGALISEALTLTTTLPLTLAALQDGDDFLAARPDHGRRDRRTWIRPGRPRSRRTSWTPTRQTRPAAARPGNWSRAGSGPRRAPGANATTRSASKHATPNAPRTGGWSIYPDRDGMAWLSAYLPADTAAGIWERTTAAARALQGPDEARTLAQLRADVAATWLLTTDTAPAPPTAPAGRPAGAGTAPDRRAGADGSGGGTGAGGLGVAVRGCAGRRGRRS